MRELKPGDRVRINDKFGLAKKYEGQVFTVASEPWTVGSIELVKLKDQCGSMRVDSLELCEMSKELVPVLEAIAVLRDYCRRMGSDCCECLLHEKCDYSPEDWDFE